MRKQRSPFGSMRTQAFTAWRGPDVLFTDDEHSGRNVLRLAAYRNIMKPLLESRIVYDRPLAEEDKESPDAFLRAVYWDGSAAQEAMRKQGDAATMSMPARCVKIRREQVHQWLKAFEGIPIFWEPFQDTTNMATMYTLRIQYNPISSVLERTWEGPIEVELERHWRKIWHEMSSVLATAPMVAQMHEQFWGKEEVTPDAYDFQGYRPDLFSLDVQ